MKFNAYKNAFLLANWPRIEEREKESVDASG